MMRSVSFVERLDLEFIGNHFSEALTLGDVDSDGVNELVIGNVDGVLAVFKGQSAVPLKKCSGLGTITCVGIGDLLNTEKNLLVCVNTEGVCRLFDITTPNTPTVVRAASGPSSPEQHKTKAKSMKPLHTQSLCSTNIKTMVIAPFTSAGECDLLLGHTDRRVSVYRWSQEDKSLTLAHQLSVSGQVGSVCGGTGLMLVSQPGGTYQPLINRDGELVADELVGQPQRRNPTSFTVLVGSVAEAGSADRVGLCTLDGTIRMVKGGVKQWELQVDHSLFAIEKLDVTGSGSDEIVACAWDGMTYIVDLSRNIVRYKFDQNVSAFTAGYYGLSAGHNVPCLVYSTFSNHIYVYHNITLPAVPASNLFTAYHTHVESTGSNTAVETNDDCKRQRTFREALYQTA